MYMISSVFTCSVENSKDKKKLNKTFEKCTNQTQGFYKVKMCSLLLFVFIVTADTVQSKLSSLHLPSLCDKVSEEAEVLQRDMLVHTLVLQVLKCYWMHLLWCDTFRCEYIYFFLCVTGSYFPSEETTSRPRTIIVSIQVSSIVACDLVQTASWDHEWTSMYVNGIKDPHL